MKKVYWFLVKIARIYWKIFKPKTYGSRAIIIFEDKEILLVKNVASKHWSLPGGHIKKNETPEDCIAREIKEELSISVKLKYKLGDFLSRQEGKKDTVYIFVVKVLDKSFKKTYELEDAKWFDISNLPENISPAGMRRIKECVEGRRNIIGKW